MKGPLRERPKLPALTYGSLLALREGGLCRHLLATHRKNKRLLALGQTVSKTKIGPTSSVEASFILASTMRRNPYNEQIDNNREYTTVLPEFVVRKDPFRSIKSQRDDAVEVIPQAVRSREPNPRKLMFRCARLTSTSTRHLHHNRQHHPEQADIGNSRSCRKNAADTRNVVLVGPHNR